MSAAALLAPTNQPVPTTPTAQLHALHRLLSRPGTWLPGDTFRALDIAGRSVRCRSPEAVRFGVLAALVRLAGPEEERQRAIAYVAKASGAPSLFAWEALPSPTESEVLAVLDAAISLAARGGA